MGKSIGTLPEQIQKLMNLTGIWSGGCLVQMHSDKLGGLWVTTSFGLTNSDMPTSSKLEHYKVESKDGKAVRYEQRISKRIPVELNKEWAGYGYEIGVLTKEKAMWPYMFLNSIVQMEILKDVGLLGRIDDIGAVTVEKIRISEKDYANFIIFNAPEPLFKDFILPNGKGRMLLAMNISEEEMNYALKNGQVELLNLLISKNVIPISDLGRGSII